jgi:choline dehydrogenase-like flavoprotein
VRMGTSPSDACVDTNFKVFGLKNLRVVDLSILPLLPK